MRRQTIKQVSTRAARAIASSAPTAAKASMGFQHPCKQLLINLDPMACKNRQGRSPVRKTNHHGWAQPLPSAHQYVNIFNAIFECQWDRLRVYSGVCYANEVLERDLLSHQQHAGRGRTGLKSL